MEEKHFELYDENGELVNTIYAARGFAEAIAAENGYTYNQLGEEDEAEKIDEFQAKIEIMWEILKPKAEGLSAEQIIKHEKALKAVGLGALFEDVVKKLNEERTEFKDGQPPPAPERGGSDE